MIPSQGDANAKLFLLTDCPTREDENKNRYFTGSYGAFIERTLAEVGISMSDTWQASVIPYHVQDINAVPRAEIEQHKERIRAEIQTICPNCVLALGELAMETVTLKHKIMNWRGSVLPSTVGSKCIPTLAAWQLYAHGDDKLPWIYKQFITKDLERAAVQCTFPEIRVKHKVKIVAKNAWDVIAYLDRHKNDKICVVDVETSKTIPVCIGLAHNAHEAISIPTLEHMSEYDAAIAWKTLAEYFADPSIKFAAWNGKFDVKRCRQLGLNWHALWLDIPSTWHFIYSEMPKGLQHVMSFLTEEPYHKDEGKEFDPKKDDITKLFLYNATDCTTEYETMERILEMLESAGLSDAFWRMAQPQYAMYSDMEDVGIKLDTETQAKLHAKYTVFRTEKKKQLVATIQGEDLGALRVRGKSKGQVVIKSIDVANINCNSPQQISALLYGYLGLPARRDVGEATLKALANNVAKKPSHKAIIKMILEDRKIGKTIGTYLEAEAGTYPVNLWTPFQGTERIFTQYNINGTSSGRTSTSICKPPVALRDQGLALQTMTKHGDETLDVGGADLRAMFIADEGWTIVEADLAGAEDRVVAVLAKDWDALRLLEKTEFRYNEHGLKDDRHTLTGMMVTGKDFFAMTDYDRQIGKRTRHAGNYLMQKHQGMITFAKYGLYLPEAVVGVMLDRFHAANPNIKNVFHEDIKYALEFNNRTLVSPFGRREVFFEQWGEDLWKKAFSFIPQATVSESVRLAMLRILKRADRKHFHFIMEAHDSCVSLVRDEYVNYYCKIVREEMSRPIDFNKCTLSRDYQLVIPTDIKIGKRWVEASVEYPDGMQKWKG